MKSKNHLNPLKERVRESASVVAAKEQAQVYGFDPIFRENLIVLFILREVQAFSGWRSTLQAPVHALRGAARSVRFFCGRSPLSGPISSSGCGEWLCAHFHHRQIT